MKKLLVIILLSFINDVRAQAIKPRVIFVPESKVVAAGTKYKGEIILTGYCGSKAPVFFVNGSPVNVTNGSGHFEFEAGEINYDENGNAYKKVTGKAVISGKDGKDTTVIGLDSFAIARPVISTQSASIASLYRNCGNDLNIQVPALGLSYNPRITADGANIIPGSIKGMITVVPVADKVTLTVYSNNQLIGSQIYSVRSVPKPLIILKAKKNDFMPDDKISKTFLQDVFIKAIPDRSFESFLPKDARYKVTSCLVAVKRNGRVIKQATVTAEALPKDFFTNVQAGDVISITTNSVTRTNYLNQTESVEGFSGTTYNLTVKE
ncbi:MAG TPA: GldM family protein [Cytophagaceae bacterium]|jgi:gliding motility-associated protein GldM|nr:GldM family protein [Cytophagaceae bacterium]